MFHAAAMAMGLAKAMGARVPAEPKTHDYTEPRWGHASSIMKIIDGGQRLRATGHGYGISKGDHLLLPNGAEASRYRVDRIEYMRDPTDQWFADLSFAPRKAAQA